MTKPHDDIPQPPDNEGLFYSLPDEDPDDDISSGRRPPRPPHAPRNPLLLLAKLICTPVEGWKELKRSKCSLSAFSWRCFYPLVLGAAVAEFADLFYEADAAVADCIIHSIIIFMSLLLGNFCTVLGSDLLMSTDIREKMNSTFGRIFIMALMSIIALTVILWNILPPLSPLLSFIPIYLVYLIVRGVKYLRIPDNMNTRSIVVLSILIIGLPMALYTIFTELIP